MNARAKETSIGSLLQCMVTLLLLASACAANEPAGNQATAADRNDVAAQLSISSDADSDLKYFPLEHYRKYPLQVRDLIRSIDIEDGPCEGSEDAHQEKYRACNRRHRMLVELERRGWCWGQGAVKVHISANDHWLPCSEDPTRRPGQLGEIPFPEAE